MNDYEDNVDDRDLALALRRLDSGLVIPEPDPVRESALLRAFDAAHPVTAPGTDLRQYWYMGALATAAAILIVVGLGPAPAGRHGTPPDTDPATQMPLSSTSRGAQPAPSPPNEFVMVPGASMLPPMESGTLVRVDVPVALLPSLGLTPAAAGRDTAVTADLVLAQDGLPRAARLVN